MKRILNLGLLVMTVAAGVAQAEVQAKFHLPFAAHWGQVILPAGDYRFSLPSAALGNRQFLVQGNDVAVYIQPLVTDYDAGLKPDSSHSYLELVNVNGAYFVVKYRSGGTGKTFSFAGPKHKHHMEMTDQKNVTLGVSGI